MAILPLPPAYIEAQRRRSKALLELYTAVFEEREAEYAEELRNETHMGRPKLTLVLKEEELNEI